jgi:hypothetical protein
MEVVVVRSKGLENRDFGRISRVVLYSASKSKQKEIIS